MYEQPASSVEDKPKFSFQNDDQSQAKHGKFRCHKCPETFDDIRRIKCHWHDVHNLKHPKHCKMCDIAFPSNHEAIKHKKEAHALFCPVCGDYFSNVNKLDNHVYGAHAIRLKYPCEFCGRNLKQKKLLIRHMERHESSLTETLVLRCSICGKKCVNDNELREHEKIHDDPMHCEFCNELLPRKSALQAHKRKVHPLEHNVLKQNATEERRNQSGKRFKNKRRRSRR